MLHENHKERRVPQKGTIFIMPSDNHIFSAQEIYEQITSRHHPLPEGMASVIISKPSPDTITPTEESIQSLLAQGYTYKGVTSELLIPRYKPYYGYGEYDISTQFRQMTGTQYNIAEFESPEGDTVHLIVDPLNSQQPQLQTIDTQNIHIYDDVPLNYVDTMNQFLDSAQDAIEQQLGMHVTEVRQLVEPAFNQYYQEVFSAAKGQAELPDIPQIAGQIAGQEYAKHIQSATLDELRKATERHQSHANALLKFVNSARDAIEERTGAHISLDKTYALTEQAFTNYYANLKRSVDDPEKEPVMSPQKAGRLAAQEVAKAIHAWTKDITLQAHRLIHETHCGQDRQHDALPSGIQEGYNSSHQYDITQTSIHIARAVVQSSLEHAVKPHQYPSMEMIALTRTENEFIHQLKHQLESKTPEEAQQYLKKVTAAVCRRGKDGHIIYPSSHTVTAVSKALKESIDNPDIPFNASNVYEFQSMQKLLDSMKEVLTPEEYAHASAQISEQILHNNKDIITMVPATDILIQSLPKEKYLQLADVLIENAAKTYAVKLEQGTIDPVSYYKNYRHGSYDIMDSQTHNIVYALTDAAKSSTHTEITIFDESENTRDIIHQKEMAASESHIMPTLTRLLTQTPPQTEFEATKWWGHLALYINLLDKNGNTFDRFTPASIVSAPACFQPALKDAMEKLQTAYKVALHDTIQSEPLTKEEILGHADLSESAVYDAAKKAFHIINGDRDMSSTPLSITAEAITYDGESVQFPTAGIAPIPIDETLFEEPSNEELACYGNLCLQTDPHSYSVGDFAIGDEDIDPDEDDF